MKNGFYTILSHIATWGVLFLLPMTFRRIEYPLSLIPTMVVIGIFYLNYLWLTPRFYMQGHKVFCWVFNAVLVVVLALLMNRWVGVGRGYFFNLAVSVIIAISMRLGSLWQESEEARLTAEAARADAELSNLRYQMNPHFLLNTLNNIYALTAFDTRRAQEAIQQLSAMLRHMLYDNMEDEVQMEEEVKFLESYIKLMKIRLPVTVEVSFDATEARGDVKIAPLILIPLVENAFKHGISSTIPIMIWSGIDRAGNLSCCFSVIHAKSWIIRLCCPVCSSRVTIFIRICQIVTGWIIKILSKDFPAVCIVSGLFV